MIAAEGGFRELRGALQIRDGVRKIAALVGLVAALEQRRAFFRLSRDVRPSGLHRHEGEKCDDAV